MQRRFNVLSPCMHGFLTYGHHACPCYPTTVVFVTADPFPNDPASILALALFIGANAIPPVILYLKRPTMRPGQRESYVTAVAWWAAAGVVALAALPVRTVPWMLIRLCSANDEIAKTLTLVLSQTVFKPAIMQVLQWLVRMHAQLCTCAELCKGR